MILIETVRTSSGIDIQSEWGIYELNTEEREAMNGNFALLRGVISDDWLVYNGHALDILQHLKRHYYEGIFQTRLEAFYHAKLAEMEVILRKIRGFKIPVVEWMEV